MPGLPSFPDTLSHEVLLFASLREIAGERIVVQLPAGGTVAELVQGIAAGVPALAPWLPYVRVAVNCEYADGPHVLSAGDEIALLPPVSGGSQAAGTAPVEDPASDLIQVLVTDRPLDVAALIAGVTEAAGGGAGAVVPFIGIVRDNARGQNVTHLEYHAYGTMAEAELRKIIVEARGRWHCACSCAHRTGSLRIGEASLVVVVAAAHRAEAFEACRWIVDEIKQRVPVWKKEHAANGTFWVEDPFAPGASNDAGQPEAGQPLA